MNAMPFSVFELKATVVDDHFDEPSTAEELEEAFRKFLKERKLRIRDVEVTELQRGMK